MFEMYQSKLDRKTKNNHASIIMSASAAASQRRPVRGRRSHTADSRRGASASASSSSSHHGRRASASASSSSQKVRHQSSGVNPSVMIGPSACAVRRLGSNTHNPSPPPPPLPPPPLPPHSMAHIVPNVRAKAPRSHVKQASMYSNIVTLQEAGCVQALHILSSTKQPP